MYTFQPEYLLHLGMLLPPCLYNLPGISLSACTTSPKEKGYGRDRAVEGNVHTRSMAGILGRVLELIGNDLEGLSLYVDVFFVVMITILCMA